MSAPVDVPVGVGARAPWQTLIAVVVVAVGAGLAVRHWPVLDAGADQLVVADRGWLSLAALLSVLTWAGAALALQGAVREALPAGRLVAAQFAASAANHVLPAGLGAGAVNLRFLTRCGLAPGRAATALAVKGAAGAVVRVVLVAGLAVACPGVLRLPSVGGTKLVVGAVVAGAAAAVGVAVLLGRQARHRQRTALPRQTGLGQRTTPPQRTGLGQRTELAQQTEPGQRTELPRRTGLAGVRLARTGVPRRSRPGRSAPLRRASARAVADVRAVHTNPSRAAALWGGSLVFALLHTGVVIAVVRALDLPLPAGEVALAYLAASSAAVLLPTPGGLGSLDAALAWALTAAGASAQASVSVVIGYRLLTVWVPLVPALLVLAGLVRARVL